LASDQLYMTVDPPVDALRRARFVEIGTVLVKGGLALHRAR